MDAAELRRAAPEVGAERPDRAELWGDVDGPEWPWSGVGAAGLRRAELRQGCGGAGSGGARGGRRHTEA